MRKGFTFGYKKSLPPILLTPGPADYSLLPSKPLLSHPITQSTRFPTQNSLYQTPGPGSYNPKEPLSLITRPHISRSLRDSGCFILNKEVPGPGKYNLPYSIGEIKYKPIKSNREYKEPKDLTYKKTTTPGPGTYSINESFYKAKEVGKKITSKRVCKFKTPSFVLENQNPGPGDYETGAISRKGPFFSFGNSLCLKGKNIGPGPVFYDVNVLNRSGLGNRFFRDGNYSFSKSTRKFEDVNEKAYFPGPGAYNLRTKILNDNGQTFNNAIRPLFKTSSFTPGPGSYLSLSHLGTKKKDQGYCLSKNIKNKKWRRKFKRQGSWDSVEEEEKKMKLLKQNEFLEKMQETKGKNTELMNGSPKYAQTPSHFGDSFNFDLKKLRRMNTDSEIKTKNYQMNHLSQKIELIPISNLPSPKLKRFATIKTFSIGKSVRKLEFLENPNNSRSPGPAGYSLERKLDKKAFVMGTSKRDKKYLILNENPEPGRYQNDTSSFIKKTKKNNKINPNLLKLLKRIELKVHPERNLIAGGEGIKEKFKRKQNRNVFPKR